MKLNPNCIRDTLFYLEEHLTISDELEFQEIGIYSIQQDLHYPIQELANTLIILHEAGFIEIVTNYSNDCISLLYVYRITYSGYQFIESIRPEPVWKKVLAAGKYIGSFSINVISQIAASTLVSMANSYLTGQLPL